MANICTTTYLINGPKDIVKPLYDEICVIMETPDKWIGKLTTHHNVSSSDTRGWFSYIEQEYLTSPDNKDASFMIVVDSKWNRSEALDELFFRTEEMKELNVLFAEEELGCDILVTNDYDNIVWGEYLFDNGKDRLYLNKDTLIDKICKTLDLNPNDTSLDQALKAVKDYNDANACNFYIRKFDYEKL